MFDIGFFELLLIGVVALLVLGPERLPHAAKMTGAFVGKIRRSVIEIQSQIEAEIDTKAIQQKLKEEADKTGLTELHGEFKAGMDELNKIQTDENNADTEVSTLSSPQRESSSSNQPSVSPSNEKPSKTTDNSQS